MKFLIVMISLVFLVRSVDMFVVWISSSKGIELLTYKGYRFNFSWPGAAPANVHQMGTMIGQGTHISPSGSNFNPPRPTDPILKKFS